MKSLGQAAIDTHTVWDHGPSAVGDGRRILHVTTRQLRGGAERNIAHLVDWEIAAGYEVEVAVGRDSDARTLPSSVRVHHLRSLVRAVRPLSDWRALRDLRSLIQDGAYDMVHTHLSKAGIVGREVARRRTRRIVHTVHMASFGMGYGPLGSRAFRAAERRAARFTDALVFVGDGLRDLYLREGIGTPASTAVIHSPIEIDRFVASRAWDAERRRAARVGLGIEPDGFLVVAIGSLEPRKRHDRLIIGLRDSLSRGDIRLVIAGDGPERARLEGRAAKHGLANRVQFLGYLPDVVPVLAAADVLALTSTTEGVPQVVIQALAAGRPIVATDVPGLREVPGAPVTIVSDVDRLDAAMRHALAAPGVPVLPTALSPWTCAVIDQEIAAFHARFDQ